MSCVLGIHTLINSKSYILTIIPLWEVSQLLPLLTMKVYDLKGVGVILFEQKCNEVLDLRTGSFYCS